MAKFLYVYHGSGKMPTDAAERQAAMDAWNGWYGKLGSAVVDGGNPVGMSKTVLPGGKVENNGGSNPTAGYTIIEANDIDDAVEKAKDCPILMDPGQRRDRADHRRWADAETRLQDRAAYRRRGAGHGAGADAVGDPHRPPLFSSFRACAAASTQARSMATRTTAMVSVSSIQPTTRDRGEIDDGRQQRQVEHHDLGIAERHRHAGEEQLCRRIPRAASRPRAPRPGPSTSSRPDRRDRRRRPISDDEGEMEGLRHHRQPEHRQRQPDAFADPHGEQERKHVAKALCDDPRHQGGDRRAGRARGDEKRGGEDQKRGEVPCCAPQDRGVLISQHRAALKRRTASQDAARDGRSRRAGGCRRPPGIRPSPPTSEICVARA